MRWTSLQRSGQVRALEFCRELLAHFDTSPLDWVRIDLGRGRIRGAYGRCWYPITQKPKKGYRISIQVPGPFRFATSVTSSRFIRTTTEAPRRSRWRSLQDIRSDPEWSRSTLAAVLTTEVSDG